MKTHDSIVEAFNAYVAENEKLTVKGVKASAARARKALLEVCKLAKIRRAEIVEEKEKM